MELSPRNLTLGGNSSPVPLLYGIGKCSCSSTTRWRCTFLVQIFPGIHNNTKVLWDHRIKMYNTSEKRIKISRILL